MHRPTQTILGNKARKAVLDGVNAIYDPVRRTLGPQAKKALLYRTFNRGGRIVDDGYAVAECQEPKDPFIRMVASAFKEGTKRTNERVGDGTTTTTVIGGKLMNDVYSLSSETSSSIGTIGTKGKGLGSTTLRKNILESAEKVKQAIKDSAKKVGSLKELENIAIISADDEEVGKTVAKMAWEVGVDGFIDVVEGYKGEIETEITQGCRFPAKIAAKAFLNNPSRYEMVATDCPVVVTNYALESAKQAADDFINPLIEKNPRLIIIAPRFSDEVLVDIFKAMYTVDPQGNRVKKPGYDIFPVFAPSLRTEQFEDVAVYCGARFIDKSKGHTLKGIKVTDAGFLEKLIVKDTESREDAIATGGRGAREDLKIDSEKPVNESIEKTSPVNERIATLKNQIKETQQEIHKKILERRIASLASAGGIIRVGDSTQASSLYRKLKIEDAVFACKAALRGGYVKGGGLCLKEIAETLPDNDILKNALIAPYHQIQSSVDGGIEIGSEIIDPMEMIYYAVEHATQIIANLSTVEILTPELDDPVHGEGELAIARMIGEVSIALKKHYGQLKENEEEMERDNMNSLTKGLSIDEFVNQDNG